MIKIEFFKTRNDGVNLYRTYSDNNVLIKNKNTEEIYDEAIDIEGSNNEYEETDINIENDGEEVQDGNDKENSQIHCKYSGNH